MDPYGSKTREELVEEMFAANYCNEAHIQAFARALSVAEDDVPSSPVVARSRSSSTLNPVPKHVLQARTRKISAVSDFAPIHTKVKRSLRRTGGKRPRPSIKSEPLYMIFRWPILLLLNTVIAFEFGLYVFIRQLVNAFEWFLAWRGPKRTLRSHLRNARSWQEWKLAASVLDEFLGFDDWKRDDEDPYYDYRLVRKVRRSLHNLRANNDAAGMMELLEVCLKDNFAGTQSARLYAETFYGTKDNIEALANEMEAALAYIRTSPGISLEEKRRFYRHANRNLGASALCLSGGASFGFYHFGVIKALLDANLMPRVYNGTSAGTLSAAFACTHTDEEMRLLMGPRLADQITCFEESMRTVFGRLYHTGAMFDAVQWARKSTWFTRGSMTFREAYERTGKVLNISVIPADQHSPTKLLNYLTAPNCVIWSAAIASSAVPTIINPVVLMQKTKTGDVIPWNWGTKFKDGSLRVDVPLQSLNLLFNVNYPIVSQVNPHIHLFWFAPRGSAGKPVAHRKGKGWRGGFLLSAAEQFLKLELTKNFKVIRDLELMPQIIGQDWSSVFLQRFDGSITIHPRIQIKDFYRILTDPDRPNMERMIHAGELATWPTLHMIENRFRLEREIFRGRLAVRQQILVPSEPTTDTAATGVDSAPMGSSGMIIVQPRLDGGLGAPIPPPTSPAPFNRAYSTNLERPSLTETQHASGSTSRSNQLAIESEAEEDFEIRSHLSSKKSRSGKHSHSHSLGGSRRTSPAVTIRGSRHTPTNVDVTSMGLVMSSTSAGTDNGLPSASSLSPGTSANVSRKPSSATISSRKGKRRASTNLLPEEQVSGPSTHGGRTRSPSASRSGANSPSNLIARLRKQSLPRIPLPPLFGAGRRRGDGTPAESSSATEIEGTVRGKRLFNDPFAPPDAWSSDEDSLDDPAFEVDTLEGLSLDGNAMDGTEGGTLGLGVGQTPEQYSEPPQQDSS
ncbi:patatin-domain-containing protein [Clavulina sp. PMI_390]|nr:patatin-domain-containing protein [Clavulina sp. PMI_390]